MSETGFLPVPDMSAPPSEHVASEPAQPFPDATLEDAYQFDRKMLLTPAPATGKGLVLLGSLALFILSEIHGSNTAFDVGALVAVLFIHELGHFVGMKLFRYRDVKMFFIPFFGAAVSGRKGRVAGWKEAVVLLLGPLPGLLAGTVLSFYIQVHPSPLLRSVALSAIAINAFNLLPIAPLDGGQLFHTLIFSRHRYLELAFRSLAGVLLIAGGAALKTPILPIIGVLMLATLAPHARMLKAAQELRSRYGAALPADPAELKDAQARDLFVQARKVSSERRKPRDGAALMEQVLSRAVSQTPSVLASFALFVLWGIGALVALIGIFSLEITSTPDWRVQTVPKGGFSIRMPHHSPVGTLPRETPIGNKEMASLDATGTSGQFHVRWYDLPQGATPEDEGKHFLDQSRDLLLSRLEGRLLEEGPLPDGRPGRALRMATKSYDTLVARVMLVDARVFILMAPAEPATEAKMFFDSFTLLSETAKSTVVVPL